jgi:hypothetical protein
MNRKRKKKHKQRLIKEQKKLTIKLLMSKVSANENSGNEVSFVPVNHYPKLCNVIVGENEE